MPRTVGVIDGTPDYRRLSIRWVDAQGDLRSDSITISNAATDLEKEALIQQLAAASNANIYQVEDSAVYAGNPDPSDATDAVVNSAYGNIVFMFKDASTQQTKRAYIPAPIDTLFVPQTDTPDPTQPAFGTLATAVLALIGGGYQGISLRYTERSEKNERVLY